MGPHELPFGKYFGKKAEELPIEYCRWLLGQDWFQVRFGSQYLDVKERVKAYDDAHPKS